MGIMEIARAFDEMLKVSWLVHNYYAFSTTAYIVKNMDLFKPHSSNHWTVTIHYVIRQWIIRIHIDATTIPLCSTCRLDIEMI